MTDKKVNYSPELTALIVEAYEECADSDGARSTCIQSLSAEHGKTVKSIRQKLVREGVYIKKAYVSKTGNRPETKAGIVEAIAKIIGVTSEQLGGMENATKPALELVRAQFVEATAALAAAYDDSEATLPDSK